MLRQFTSVITFVSRLFEKYKWQCTFVKYLQNTKPMIKKIFAKKFGENRRRIYPQNVKKRIWNQLFMGNCCISPTELGLR